MARIIFPRKPNFYDARGAPYYISKCNKYRLLRIRTGFRNKEGKWQHDNWYVHFNRGRKLDWISPIMVGQVCADRKEAEYWAGEHDLFLRMEKHLEKKRKDKEKGKKKGSRKPSKPLRRRRKSS